MRISSAEGVIMEALWERQPLYAEDIIATVAPDQDWTEGTVKTLLNRLLGKGAIAAEKEGRRYSYRPVLKREDYVLDESTNLVDRHDVSVGFSPRGARDIGRPSAGVSCRNGRPNGERGSAGHQE